MDTINKLQFRHHNEIITGATLSEAREAVIKYLYDKWYDTTAYNDPNSNYRSLYAEPTVFRYAVEGEESDPHIILMIGADTNDGSRQEYNKFCIIDIDKTEQEIADLQEELEKAIKSLTIIALSSDTLNLYADKTDDGTYVSGDVKTARYHMFGDDRLYNNLMVASASDEGPEGLFIYVDLIYDEEAETFTFVVTNADGTLKKQEVKLPNNYLVSGRYSIQDQSLHLKMKNGDDVVVDCTYLIAEWDTEKELSKTPIVLVKEPVGYGEDAEYYHLEPWQDVLRADVRLRDEVKDAETGKYVKDPNSTNILNRTANGQYLYVDGKASNIIYYWEGEKSNVKNQLDKLNKIKISKDDDNIIWDRVDGFFASTKLEYISNKNQLVFTTTNVSGGTTVKNIQLNSVELFQNIYYDPTTEELVLTYKDSEGNLKVVRIPIGQMLDEWDVLSEGHSVKLVKKPHQVSGKDILTADVKISDGEDNILVDRNHSLYVQGTADNIKYEEGTVKGALDSLISEDETLNQKIEAETARAEATEQALDAKIDQETSDREADVDEEQARAEAAEQELTDKIGTGFTSDPHENVTYKFEQLSDRVATEEARAASEEARIEEKLDSEIARATEKDAEHDEKLAEQQTEIEAISADSALSLKDIINNDHSIGIDKTDATKPVIKVNLSGHEPMNTIRLEGDGLYNFVDLTYDDNKNKLTLIRSKNGSTINDEKEIQLNNVSFIDSIEYDRDTETLIITYHVGEEVKTVTIDLHDLIHEWEVYNDPDSAVKLTRIDSVSGIDKLSAEVVITTAHTDNILANEHGALYVPGAQIEKNKQDIEALSGSVTSEISRAESAEDALNNKIDSEISRATNAESALNNSINEESIRAISAETALSGAISTVQTNLQTETDRATAAETRIETKLDNEISRSTAEDQELRTLITQEALRATSADTILNDKINDEITERINADASLSGSLTSAISQESTRAQMVELGLTNSINNEISRAQATEEVLASNLANEVAAREAADAALQSAVEAATLTFEDTNTIDITKDANNNVKADVKLANSPDNIITLDSVNAGLYSSVKFNYEPATNKITFTVNGVAQEFSIAAGSILEDAWYESTTKDLVFKTKTAEGEYVEVRIPAYDLFDEWEVEQPVSGTALSLTLTTGRTDPTSHEPLPNQLSGTVLISPLEDNALIMDTNGLYVPSSGSAIATCVSGQTAAIYKILQGDGEHIEGCGETTSYKPYTGSCVISAATSFYQADQMLSDELCNLLNMWISGLTCTNLSYWEDYGLNRTLKVDSRLSHGSNIAGMTDDDLFITNLTGDTIEVGVNEFTDTNALRIVCLNEGPVIPDVSTPQNGIYLSNVWDCGRYYGTGTTEQSDAAQAAADGYNVDYHTDESGDAATADYSNYKRMSDPLC